MNVPRQTGGANVKFIRIGGDAPPARRAAAAAAPGGAGVADAAAAAAASPAARAATPATTRRRRQLAAWLGREAEKRGLPKQLPVMASLVESGVKNLNYGDADSVGFFQMRVGIWNKGDYAGFPEKPELQIKWFLDQAEAVKKQRIARGQSVTDPKQFGDWIADIERPAAQYRSRYGMRLGEANALLERAGDAPPAPAPRRPRPRRSPRPPTPPRARPAGGGGAGPQALAALKEAQKYTGTAYRYGGSTPQTGFDCSGLVQWAYAKAGIQIPRVTDAQFAASNGTPVDTRGPQAGRPHLLRQAGQHLPRRDLDGRGQVPARAQDRRRREGREPQRLLLLPELRRRPPLRPCRTGRRGGGRAAPRRGRAPRRRSTRRPSRRHRPRWRATRPRSSARTPASSWRSRRRRSGATRPCSS